MLSAEPIAGFPEVAEGDDLAALIAPHVRAGDVVVLAHKVVSKAEGRVVDLRTITPRPEAVEFAERFDRDPRQVEVVLRESVHVLRMERGVIISWTRHGFVCANAVVDA